MPTTKIDTDSSPRAHCEYLLDTLIPDCIESGSEGHARDHAESVYWIAKSQAMLTRGTDLTWFRLRDRAQVIYLGLA